jgi:hypothetical protein
MVEEYGGTVQFSELMMQMAAASFLHAEKALQQLPLVRSWDETTINRISAKVSQKGLRSSSAARAIPRVSRRVTS